ncbi:MAG: hypothetical protein R3F61_12470 [Myxococcota bacterium]
MRTIIFSAVLLTAAACRTDAVGIGRSLAMQDDGGVVAVTWDGSTVRAWRGATMLLETSASTWESAMWSVDLPAYGQVSAPHFYDRMLSAREIADLGECGWARSNDSVECGWNARCDCGSPRRTVEAMARAL